MIDVSTISMYESLRFTGRFALACAFLALIFGSSCTNEHYDDVPIDINYHASANGDVHLTSTDGREDVPIGDVGVAIGFTRIHLCDEHFFPGLSHLQRLIVPEAHAHSPSTPTSSGIPVVLSTAGHAPAYVPRALSPPRGITVCSVEIQLLNADNDILLLDDMPNIVGAASVAQIRGEWIQSLAGPSRTFDLDAPITIDHPLLFDLHLDQQQWEQELQAMAPVPDDPQHIGDMLQDAVLRSLILTISDVPDH